MRSHSSANRTVASKLEKAPEAAGLSVWLDDSEITLAALLGRELQDSIRASHVLLLPWSEHAASSRWVASEWLRPSPESVYSAVRAGRHPAPPMIRCRLRRNDCDRAGRPP